MSDSSPPNEFQLLPQASSTFKNAVAQITRRTFALNVQEQELSGHPTYSSTPDPHILALGRAARICSTSRVLEVGTGTGYRAAVLAKIVAEVHTIESVKVLAEHAQARYAELGIENVHVHWKDGLEGLAAHAPFDRIIVSVPNTQISQTLKEQLAPDGILVSLRQTGSVAQVQRITRVAHAFEEELLNLRGDVLGLGDIIIEMGLLDRARLEHAAKNRAPDQSLGQTLLRQGLLDEASLYRALAVQHNVEYGSAQQLLSQMEPGLYQSVSHAYLEHNHVLPIRREGGRLLVATTNPTGNFKSLAVALGVAKV